MSGRDRLGPRLFGVVLAGGRSRRYGSPKARVRLAGLTLLERGLNILRAAGLETGVIANRADDLPVPWADQARREGWIDPRPPEGGPSSAPGSARADHTTPTPPPPAATGGSPATVSERDPASARDTLAHPPPATGPPAPPTAAVPVRPDLTPGAGPLGGLHAALAWARERGDAGVFLLGCDLPFVPPALVARLATGFDRARPTVPASSGPLGMEPLCACYPVGLAEAAREWLEAGRLGMGEFVRAHDPVVVAGDPLASIAGAEHAFLNVNTPADRDRATRLLARRRRTARG